ncbi:hypothetical protein THAOC_28280, partial [Thalassiosira oceanica]
MADTSDTSEDGSVGSVGSAWTEPSGPYETATLGKAPLGTSASLLRRRARFAPLDRLLLRAAIGLEREVRQRPVADVAEHLGLGDQRRPLRRHAQREGRRRSPAGCCRGSRGRLKLQPGHSVSGSQASPGPPPTGVDECSPLAGHPANRRHGDSQGGGAAAGCSPSRRRRWHPSPFRMAVSCPGRLFERTTGRSSNVEMPMLARLACDSIPTSVEAAAVSLSYVSGDSASRLQ